MTEGAARTEPAPAGSVGALRQWLRRARPDLCATDLDLVLQKATGWPRIRLYSDSERRPEMAARRRIGAMQRCLAAGEPIELVLGECQFAGIELRLRPGVLVPRIETEGLVALGLERLPRGGTALDLGTGSGAVALALKAARPDAAVTGTDLDPGALALAADNGKRLGLPVRWLAGDWCQPVRGEDFDLILANPPYVEADYPGLDQLLQHEPRRALLAGPTGLEALQQIAAAVAADGLLHGRNGGGWLIFEHGAEQAEAVRALLADCGFCRGFTARDCHDRPRFSGARVR